MGRSTAAVQAILLFLAACAPDYQAEPVVYASRPPAHRPDTHRATDRVSHKPYEALDDAVLALKNAQRDGADYIKRRPCPSAPPCADPAEVKRISAADKRAFAATNAAAHDSAELPQAWEAIDALRASLPSK